MKKIKYNHKLKLTKRKLNKKNTEIEDSIPFYDDYDSHSCYAEADGYGICTYCGKVIPGSMAYLSIYGGE